MDFISNQIMKIRVSDNLPYWLDRKGFVVITKLTELTICRTEASGKPIGVGFCQWRDVGSDFSPGIFIVSVMLDLIKAPVEVVSEAIKMWNYQIPHIDSFQENKSMCELGKLF